MSIRHCPALGNHPGVHVFRPKTAYRNDPPISVDIAFVARHGLPADEPGQCCRRLLAASILVTARILALLGGFRCIDTVKANPLAPFIERVAVNHARCPFDVGRRRGIDTATRAAKHFGKGRKILTMAKQIPDRQDADQDDEQQVRPRTPRPIGEPEYA